MKLKTKLLAVLLYGLSSLFVLACGDDTSSKPEDAQVQVNVEVRYDTIRVNDSTIVIDTIKTVYYDSLYVTDSIKAILVMKHDTAYVTDSIDVRYLKSIERFDSCFTRWEGFRIVFSKDSAIYECQNGIWDTITYRVNHVDLIGFAQKGAFKFNSPVYLREALNDTLKFGKDTIKDEVSGNNGEFVIPSLNLMNPRISLEVKGQYKNEVTGKYSTKAITLQALVELPKTDVDEPRTKVKANINLLTHLEYDRALKLVRKGYGLKAAKKQAQQEIMNALALNVQTQNDSNDKAELLEIQNHGLLLAVSLLFLGDDNEDSIAKNIKQFREDIADNGAWDKNQNKVKMADWAYDLEFGDIHKNIAHWNLSKASDFQIYLNQFWSNVYGIGECAAGRANELIKNQNAKSVNKERYFVCRNTAGVLAWDTATVYEADTYGWEDGEDGEGEIYHQKYVYDEQIQKWREPKLIETHIGKCTAKLDGETVTNPINDGKFKCLNNEWLAQKDGSVTYKFAEVNGQIWFTWSYGWYSDELSLGPCPTGWRLPSREDWQALIDYSLSEHNQNLAEALAALKDETSWTSGTKGTNEYGLGLKAEGFYSKPMDTYYSKGSDFYSWISEKNDDGRGFINIHEDGYKFDVQGYSTVKYSAHCIMKLTNYKE